MEIIVLFLKIPPILIFTQDPRAANAPPAPLSPFTELSVNSALKLESLISPCKLIAPPQPHGALTELFINFPLKVTFLTFTFDEKNMAPPPL